MCVLGESVLLSLWDVLAHPGDLSRSEVCFVDVNIATPVSFDYKTS